MVLSTNEESQHDDLPCLTLDQYKTSSNQHDCVRTLFDRLDELRLDNDVRIIARFFSLDLKKNYAQ